MRILVDEEGRRVLMGLINTAMGAGAFKSVQELSVVTAAIAPIPAPPKSKEQLPAEEPSCLV